MKYDQEAISILISGAILFYFEISKKLYNSILKSSSIYFPPSNRDFDEYLKLNNDKENVYILLKF